jgi:hypothetical protein
MLAPEGEIQKSHPVIEWLLFYPVNVFYLARLGLFFLLPIISFGKPFFSRKTFDLFAFLTK